LTDVLLSVGRYARSTLSPTRRPSDLPLRSCACATARGRSNKSSAKRRDVLLTAHSRPTSAHSWTRRGRVAGSSKSTPGHHENHENGAVRRGRRVERLGRRYHSAP